jgi:hypothetical protein
MSIQRKYYRCREHINAVLCMSSSSDSPHKVVCHFQPHCTSERYCTMHATNTTTMPVPVVVTAIIMGVTSLFGSHSCIVSDGLCIRAAPTQFAFNGKVDHCTKMTQKQLQVGSGDSFPVIGMETIRVFHCVDVFFEHFNCRAVYVPAGPTHYLCAEYVVVFLACALSGNIMYILFIFPAHMGEGCQSFPH